MASAPGSWAAASRCSPLIRSGRYKDLIDKALAAEIEAASLYPIALRFGQTAGNRWSLLIPQAQAVKADDGDRGQLRSDDRGWRCINPGRDAQARDMDRIISFS